MFEEYRKKMRWVSMFGILGLGALLFSGCFIASRQLVVKNPRSVASDHYCVYTNGQLEARIDHYYNGRVETNYVNKTLYYSTSYVGGPYRGSFLYPGTRLDLNILSGWSYSSAASGNYMLNLFTIPTYPLYIVALPVEFVLDTLLIPFDLINQPHPSDDWKLKGTY